MRVVAKKGQGLRKIVAPHPAPAMSVDAFAVAFGARVVGTVGGDTSPFSLLQILAQTAGGRKVDSHCRKTNGHF